MNKYILMLLFLTLLAKSEAITIDSLSGKTNNKMSVDFAGGTTYTDYLFKKSYDYWPNGTINPNTTNNTIGKSFELNIKIPIKKSNFSVNLGIAYTERNFNMLYGGTISQTDYRNDYLSILLAVGYKLVDSKHFIVDANVGVLPSFNFYQKEVDKDNQQTVITRSTFYPKAVQPDLINQTLVPLYCKINAFYKLNQHIAMGISLGLFYDTRLPYEIILKNRINYSSNLIIRYTL